jgi:hypothetical protein
MKASIAQILRRAQPGASTAVKGHIARAVQISAAIGARWGAGHAHPYHWRLKHVRWYLHAECNGLAPATRYDHWRTVRVVLSACGRWPAWEPRLRGPWCSRTGESKKGPGGRPAKLAFRGRENTT